MVGTLQPLSDKFQLVGPDGRPTLYFIQWAQQRQIDIGEAITGEDAQQLIDDWAAARQIVAGRALDGGGFLSGNVTIDHAESLVTPGTYGDASHVPRFVVDQEGHVQGVTSVPIAGGTVPWGNITGILSAQTDLQAALDVKLSGVTDPSIFGGVFKMTGHNAFMVGDISTGAALTLFTIVAHPTYLPVMEFDLAAFAGGTFLGGNVTAANRFPIACYGTVTACEFNTAPYVNNDVIWNAGNLIFGSGLSYNSGTHVLTATGAGSAVLPVVDGSVPPVFLQNPDGSLIYTPI